LKKQKPQKPRGKAVKRSYLDKALHYGVLFFWGGEGMAALKKMETLCSLPKIKKDSFKVVFFYYFFLEF